MGNSSNTVTPEMTAMMRCVMWCEGSRRGRGRDVDGWSQTSPSKESVAAVAGADAGAGAATWCSECRACARVTESRREEAAGDVETLEVVIALLPHVHTLSQRRSFTESVIHLF